MTLSALAIDFLERKPTLIARVAGVAFYEHPTLGEDVPLIAITKDGRKKRTAYHDVPSAFEVLNDADLMPRAQAWRVTIRANDDTYTVNETIEAPTEGAAGYHADRIAGDLKAAGNTIDSIDVRKA